MRLFKRDTFLKDILLLLLVGVALSALFAFGFAVTTDKYFAKAVTGVMGDLGEYDLLFQGKEELKSAMARQIREVIAERFPGATLKAGISLAGKSTFFVTLPSQYRNQAIFNSLSYYFKNLPGNGGFSIMTEPKINISSVPTGIFEILSKEIERIPGVEFTFEDGGSIGVILKNTRVSEKVLGRIKQILKKYQILEVRLGANQNSEEVITLSKKVSQSLIGLKGVEYARDITMDGGADEYQYMLNTLLEVKKFLLAYAAEVKVIPAAGQSLEVGDLLALNGRNTKNLKQGSLLEPLNVVVKITAKDAAGISGLIIQGDSEYLRDKIAYKMLAEDKIGSPVGTVEVSSRKTQLVYAMDQGVKLLTKVNAAISDFNNATGGPGITVTGIEKVYRQLANLRKSLNLIGTNMAGLSGKTNRDNLRNVVNLINGVGDDLDYLAETFGRVQILENRFSQALDGLGTAQLVTGSPLLQGSLGNSGGIFEKMQLLNEQLNTVENALRSRLRTMDDFINRFNPLVAVLLSWRNKARDFAGIANNFQTVFTPGSANYRKLTELIGSTDRVIASITGFNLKEVKSGLGIISNRFFGTDKIDLSALIAELERIKNSLPRLLDEEIGHSVNLIDKYTGGETVSGEKIQIFTNAKADRAAVEATVKDVLGRADVGIYSLPVGTIQPDLRGELYKILAEVRSTIAALVVLILWTLSFILDHTLVISILKRMKWSLPPRRAERGIKWLDKGYKLLRRTFSWANIYAVGVGGIWLWAAFALAGARLPYLSGWQMGIIGGLLGLVFAVLAEKINPIDNDEVMAGLSLGFSFKVIMREIVIPSGRPGLFQLLNRWKMIMK